MKRLALLPMLCLAVAGVETTRATAFGQAKKKPTLPKPETGSFESAGGLAIHYVYFPGGFVQKSESEFEAKPGKEVVPIILLHGYEGRGADFFQLASGLQRMGHAVVLPDMRGHGMSKIRTADGREISPDRLTPQQFNAMVGDVETIKRMLYEKNNQGALNVELLCLIGSDLGALVATNWVALDWSRQDLPAFRQGKSAKALILLSPMPSVKGYTATNSWKHPIFQSSKVMSIMLVAGNRDAKSFKEVTQIQKRIESGHRTEPGAADRSLWLVEPDTDLAGPNLVNPKFRLPVAGQIGQFITARLANRQAEFPWSERKNPLSN